ncbi:hypothetical protein K488DRAFT_91988, partial [Vararia minispora EC-137]
MYRNRLGSYKQIPLRVSVAWARRQTTDDLKAQDTLPLLTPGQQSASPAPTAPYGGLADSRSTQLSAASGLPTIKSAPEENTINVSPAVDLPNTEPPLIASAVVDGAQRISDLVNSINTQANFWTTLLNNVNLVAQILDGISQIHPYARMACTVLSAIPKALAQQIERDANVMGLVDDLNKGFKTLREAQGLEERCSDPEQAEIIARIFQQTSECGSFIERYFRNSNFWKRFISNFAGGPDQIVEQYRTALAGLRKDFLEHTAITTKTCVLQITDRLERG